MEDIDGLVKRNRERAIELMKSHNINKIIFSANFVDTIVGYIPSVLYMTDDINSRLDTLFVREVRIDDNDNIFLETNISYSGYEININDVYFYSQNNVYVAIEDYLKITSNKHE